MIKEFSPPDISFATRKLGEVLKNYRPNSAVDIGSGCGYLAFVMKRNGSSTVYATDVNKTAVKCINKNIERNIKMRGVKTFVSDLYESIESTLKFDVIVFNHFYRPEGTGIFGPIHDGGRIIVTRFLKESKGHLNKNGVILMTFVKMSDPENDPKPIAQKLGYQVKTIHKQEAYGGIGDLYIYEIRQKVE